MREILTFLVPIVIAVVLGPLIAGLAICLLAFGNNIVGGLGVSPLSNLFGLFVFYIIFAYIIGSPIALIAGLLVSLWMLWRVPNAIVVIACAAFATCIFMGIGALGALGPVQYTNARSNFTFTLAFAIIAAAGCWLLTRRLAPAAAKPQT